MLVVAVVVVMVQVVAAGLGVAAQGLVEIQHHLELLEQLTQVAVAVAQEDLAHQIQQVMAVMVL
jgi:hypothetical protein